MWAKEKYDFNQLYDRCWSGATDTLQKIIDENLEDDLMELLDEVFPDNEDNPPSITDINDFLWFDGDSVLDTLGIPEDNEEYSEEDDE